MKAARIGVIAAAVLTVVAWALGYWARGML